MFDKHLEFLWIDKVGKDTLRDPSASDWNRQLEALFAHGISMEKALKYLYSYRPTLDEFKDWIIKNTELRPQLTDLEYNVLTEEELNFFDQNGYFVLREAVSRADAEAARQAICGFLGIDGDDPATWYSAHPAKQGLMLTLSNHPALNKNRYSPRIKKAFEQIYGHTALFCNVGITSFNPPVTSNFQFLGDGLHWDVSLKQPIAFVIQGLLYLSDCSAIGGAFHCVPGFHKNISGWLENLAQDELPRSKVKKLVPVAVPGRAGDFVGWHQALPHCATPNHGKSPRYVQYMSYRPKDYVESETWM